jgi:outer membrane protein OmpA-like peptidoglycan-associated protein
MRLGSIAAALLASAVLLCVARPGLAQQTIIDAERFKPAVTYDGFVTMEGSGVRPRADPWELGLFLNYSRNSLIAVDANGAVTHRYISGRLGFDAMFSVTLAKPFALGLDVPFFLAQTGDDSPSFAGLGDVRLVPKVRIIDGTQGFGLGISAELRAPTHAGDFAGGARMVVFAPRLIMDWRHWRGFRIGTNLGVNVREGTTFYNIDALSEFAYALGLGYRFGGHYGKVELGAEATGAVGFVPPQVWELPLEASLYVKIHPNDQWEIQLGPGFGLVRGYGVPLLRVFAGIRYTPTFHDRDHDGIPDDQDRCPDQAETYNGFQDADGCPDVVQPRVIREHGRFRLLNDVRFRTGSAQIDPDSYELLNEVAVMLNENPDIPRIRIEGHTDETGTRELNLELSKARANAVREYLISRGVKPERLRAVGYGADRPIATGSDPASLAKNRRVEFIFE